jgi:hypothetical protein
MTFEATELHAEAEAFPIDMSWQPRKQYGDYKAREASESLV